MVDFEKSLKLEKKWCDVDDIVLLATDDLDICDVFFMLVFSIYRTNGEMNQKIFDGGNDTCQHMHLRGSGSLFLTGKFWDGSEKVILGIQVLYFT